MMTLYIDEFSTPVHAKIGSENNLTGPVTPWRIIFTRLSFGVEVSCQFNISLPSDLIQTRQLECPPFCKGLKAVQLNI